MVVAVVTVVVAGSVIVFVWSCVDGLPGLVETNEERRGVLVELRPALVVAELHEAVCHDDLDGFPHGTELVALEHEAVLKLLVGALGLDVVDATLALVKVA